MANKRIVCKHTFMVEQPLSYTICYDFSGKGEPHVNSLQFFDSLTLFFASGFEDYSVADSLEVAAHVTAMAVNFDIKALQGGEFFLVILRDYLSTLNCFEKRGEASLT